MIFKTLLFPLAKSLGLAPRQKNCRPINVQMGRVVPDANRCVQCGICAYNCPIGIPVRDYAHRGLPVDDPGCITCGQCIRVCPGGTLRWETQTHAFVTDRFPVSVGLADTPDEISIIPLTANNR